MRAIRVYLRRHSTRMTIPRKANRCRRDSFDGQSYKERNRIERLINRLKQNRRLATRYEKRGESYRAMPVIGAILLWL